MEKNPDRYIEYCAKLLLPKVNQESEGPSTTNKRRKGDNRLFEPFQKFSRTEAIELENQMLENEINNLQRSLRHYKSQLKNSRSELTIQELYKIIKEINYSKKRIESLMNREIFIEPIEDEIQELNFFIRNDISNSKDGGEHQQEPHSESYNLQDRYSTFLYRGPGSNKDDDKEPLNIGEKYTTYQINKSMFRSKRDDLFLKHPELTGVYHEDYERVLVFASSLIGESINKVQEAVIKIEYDLYKSIENEGL